MSLDEREEQRWDCARKLLECEQEFISQMHYGLQRYSRPLRHCIVSEADHAILFQNVEQVIVHRNN